ncbi:uncharacterized protein LOC143834906 [Paroedura picta]|uniref:uncharacterized protein LOC143834906 n=1 Tax=Paroedura picta TaxID=143630 RepID=UPI004056A05C
MVDLQSRVPIQVRITLIQCYGHAAAGSKTEDLLMLIEFIISELLRQFCVGHKEGEPTRLETRTPREQPALLRSSSPHPADIPASIIGKLSPHCHDVPPSLPRWPGRDGIMPRWWGNALVFARRLCGPLDFYPKAFVRKPECHLTTTDLMASLPGHTGCDVPNGMR